MIMNFEGTFANANRAGAEVLRKRGKVAVFAVNFSEFSIRINFSLLSDAYQKVEQNITT